MTESRWIDARKYERIEAFAGITPGTLARLAPEGEYAMNLLPRLTALQASEVRDFLEMEGAR